MLTALKQRKLARLFKLYDVDRNGFIEQAARDCWKALVDFEERRNRPQRPPRVV